MLTSSPTDVLSHVAIRARAQNVLLASCFAPEELQAMEGLEGRHVSLSIDALGTVTAAESEAAAEASQAGECHISLSIDALKTVSAPVSEAPAEPSQAGEHAGPSTVSLFEILGRIFQLCSACCLVLSVFGTDGPPYIGFCFCIYRQQLRGVLAKGGASTKEIILEYATACNVAMSTM